MTEPNDPVEAAIHALTTTWPIHNSQQRPYLETLIDAYRALAQSRPARAVTGAMVQSALQFGPEQYTGNPVVCDVDCDATADALNKLLTPEPDAGDGDDMEKLAEFRDTVLHERGALAESEMTNDQINAVLSEFDYTLAAIKAARDSVK